MKVIHLISGGDTGGAKTHVHSLLRNRSRGMDVTLVCFRDGPFAREAAELAGKEPLLVSCGGGVVKRDENRAILRDAGFVVYLKVTADEAKSRISDTSTRPLFQDLDVARKTSEERLPLYAEVADLTIDTAGKNVATIAREVQSALEKEGILCLQRK